MSKIEPWHRRHALQLACQLPDGIDDALTILRLARELVEDFLIEPEGDCRPKIAIVPIVER
jgi:hypothetical protein